jgi:hypothetical protein
MLGRFSNPPRAEDVAGLQLEAKELTDLRACRPGKCAFKLSDSEIQAVAGPPSPRSAERDADTLARFRQIVAARAQAYLAKGLAGLAPTHDRAQPEVPAEELRQLLVASGAPVLLPDPVRQYLLNYPRSAIGESILYWSKDVTGDIKPIVSLTHLTVVPRNESEPAMAVSVQVFASHYLTASFSVTTIVGSDRPDGVRYLLYHRRSRTDAFNGLFGGLIRRIVSRKIRADGPPLLTRVRRTLEDGAVLASGARDPQ